MIILFPVRMIYKKRQFSALNCPNFIHCLSLPLHLQIEEDPKLNLSQLRSILLIAIRFASGDFSMPLSGEETRLSRWLGIWWPWDLEWYCAIYIYTWIGGFGLKFATCLGMMFYLWSDFEANIHFIWIIWQQQRFEHWRLRFASKYMAEFSASRAGFECVRESIEVRFVILKRDSWCHQDIQRCFSLQCEAGCEKSLAPASSSHVLSKRFA